MLMFSTLLLILCLLMTGLGGAFWQRWGLAQPQRLAWTCLGMLATTLVAAGIAVWALPIRTVQLFINVAPQAFSDWMAILPDVWSWMTLFTVTLLWTLGCWDRLIMFGRTDAREAATRLVPVVLAAVIMVGLLVESGPVGVRTDRPATRSFDAWGQTLFAAWLILAAMNTASLAAALTQKGFDRITSLVVCAIHTTIAIILGVVLLQLALDRLYLPSSIAELLYPESVPIKNPWIPLVLAATTYLAIVSATGIAAAIGLRLGPRLTVPLPPLHLRQRAELHLRRQGQQIAQMPIWHLRSKAKYIPVGDHTETSTKYTPPFCTSIAKRIFLLTASILFTLAACYGLIVPVNYLPLPFAETVTRFANIKYLDIGLSRLSDWTANLCLFVPLGFLYMGLVDVDCRRRFWSWLAAPIIVVLLAALAVAMEFVQIWFPPRTVSQNDIIAESIGGAVGVLLWLAFGRILTQITRDLATEQHQQRFLARVLWVYVVLFLLYTLMPFDFIFTWSAIIEKFQQNRILLIPFARPYEHGLEILAYVVRNVLMFIPIGIAVRLNWHSGNLCRSPQIAILLALAIATGAEAGQLLVFSNYTDTTDIITRGIGGTIGVVAAERVISLAAFRFFANQPPSPKRIIVALVLFAIYSCFILAVLWYPFQFVDDTEAFQDKLTYFINYPFKHYYYSGEWSAVTKLTHLALLFLPLGILTGWGFAGTQRNSWKVWVAVITATLTIGIMAEIGQANIATRTVHLMPEQMNSHRTVGGHQGIDVTAPSLSKGIMLHKGRVPDITDVMAYTAGALAGCLIITLFIPRHKEIVTPTKFLKN